MDTFAHSERAPPWRLLCKYWCAQSSSCLCHDLVDCHSRADQRSIDWNSKIIVGSSRRVVVRKRQRPFVANSAKLWIGMRKQIKIRGWRWDEQQKRLKVLKISTESFEFSKLRYRSGWSISISDNYFCNFITTLKACRRFYSIRKILIFNSVEKKK